MARYLLLVCGLFSALTALSQIPDFSPYISTITIEGKELTILRVPGVKTHEKLPYQEAVDNTQRDLDRARKLLAEGTSKAGYMMEHNLEMYLVFIEHIPSFPIRYYREEAKAYEEWSKLLFQREWDARAARVQRAKDSVRVEQLKEGYYWIIPDSVWVKQQPDAKAATIGRIYRLSYIKAYEVDGKPDWSEIQFGDHTGYILLDQLATDWDELELSDEETEKLKKGRYYNFIPTAAYKAKLAREKAAEEAAFERANRPPKRNYIRGPKGGCYYLDSNGKKQYVDHSFCR